MGYLPFHTFCHCIPVRFGVLVMSILGCIGGSIMAGLGWDSAVHKGKWRLILLYHCPYHICRGNISDFESGGFRRDGFPFIYHPRRHFSPWVRSLCATKRREIPTLTLHPG
jgi:hypothetical protein